MYICVMFHCISGTIYRISGTLSLATRRLSYLAFDILTVVGMMPSLATRIRFYLASDIVVGMMSLDWYKPLETV